MPPNQRYIPSSAAVAQEKLNMTFSRILKLLSEVDDIDLVRIHDVMLT